MTTADFTARSFGAQDQLVRRLLVEKEGIHGGSFLDVGCANPIDGNNTYELERSGWRGVLVDSNQDLLPFMGKRTSAFVCSDAATLSWPDVLRVYLPFVPVIDYLSFDVDGAALPSFMNLPLDAIRFRLLTVEHDAYRFGDATRSAMRARLTALGYELLCPDVTSQGLAYEDWWVDPKLVQPSSYELFRTTSPTECSVIVAR